MKDKGGLLRAPFIIPLIPHLAAFGNYLQIALRNYPMFGKILDFLDKILTFFEEWTLFISVIVALLALFINVVLRYGFNYSLAWSEELVREVIIYTTFIGCSAAVKNRSMIKIDASVQLLPRLKIPLTYFSNFATIIFSVMMIYYGSLMAALQVRTEQKTIIMQIPLVYLYAILPLMGTMMLIRTIQVIHQDFTEQRAKKSPEK
jgi:TRAP-type C4-dicarboxylate transport system permease small subunit